MKSRKLVFLFGAPRSGTTWLQLIMAQHPQITTVNETHLFSSYLRSAFRSWLAFQDGKRDIGLHHHMTEKQFIACLARCADELIGHCDGNHESAPVFVEKTPAHVRHWQDIVAVYPDARFIHLVRDPRAVVASMCRAGRGWGARWAAPGTIANARLWCRDVQCGRDAEEQLEERCLRLHYEALFQDGETAFSHILDWLGLDRFSEGEIKGYVTACSREGLTGASGVRPWDVGKEPQGFLGGAGVEGWKNEMSAGAVRIVESICKESMEYYGYRRTSRASYVDSFRIYLADALRSGECKLEEWRHRL